mmetsp:Transcript_15435/g.42438  ORF Transcript_15435/g.42438 Transcript_15435/m.42438 type:complete len:613 (+) Transcript_15435:133-1971(+)|eukprot:CAMPEP_0117520310 /NCGR_PEP_ID=MMETSP0784-20121206/33104_1 /TAXON_ID=39447 /ORGANISM="" /LENGTH=612 /DNA_ID=CAMNT_0005316303 /DNA_START=124 /DNA_END=1962 /DNA_ORIENTATION=+
MIDAFYIFTKGGLLLWSRQLVKVKGEPLDRLIKEVLLEERVGEECTMIDAYSFRWKLINEMDIFFVAVYQGILQMAYIEALLSLAAKEFLSRVTDVFGNGMNIKHFDFDDDFTKVLKKATKDYQESKRPRAMRSFAETKRGQDVIKNAEEKNITKGSKKKGKNGGTNAGSGSDDGGDDDDGDEAEPAAAAKAGTKPKAPPKFQKKAKEAKEAKEPTEGKKGKEARFWDGGKVSAARMNELDFSKKGDNGDDAARLKEEFIGEDDGNFMNEDDVASLPSSDDSEDDASKDDSAKAKAGRVGGLFKSLTRGVKNLTGGAVLTDEDLQPILASFKTSLMSKNVGQDVAIKLADSVKASLVGKRTDRFTSMSRTVKEVLQDAMETLLTPKKSIDVLRAAYAAKNAGRVYSIVFLGVNGVGKSTNLAKVAYFLKHKGGLNVMLCACDTFRAGAVEQLKTHARCLDVPLFERGYGKDPSDIAKASLDFAAKNGHDVVLVDTAGRMQDNEPLMRALAKLVAVNTPDLVLFVGEALVGNDAIDQVTKFNRSLIDMSHDRKHARGIDGMLLTKYDTVDDKVGAALSMVYVTGQPIIFVGCGQKYTHLRKIQAKEVVRTLLG